MSKGLKWEPKEDALLAKLYPNEYALKVAKKLKRSLRAVYKRAGELGLKKSAEFLSMELARQGKRLKKAGASSRFKIGQEPANKGKKQGEFMSREAIAKTAVTRFKKGHLPHNTKLKDGVIVTRLHKDGHHYKYVRVGIGKWVLYHRHRWEKFRGKIPKGYVLVFKDGNYENCKLGNLELITMAENMRRNTIHRYPEELQKTIKILSKLKKRINEKQN